MGAYQHFLVRRVEDGTMRTVTAQSVQSAMRHFISQYGPPVGEVFGVKPRLEGDWEFFSITSRGMRRVPEPQYEDDLY